MTISMLETTDWAKKRGHGTSKAFFLVQLALAVYSQTFIFQVEFFQQLSVANFSAQVFKVKSNQPFTVGNFVERKSHKAGSDGCRTLQSSTSSMVSLSGLPLPVQTTQENYPNDVKIFRLKPHMITTDIFYMGSKETFFLTSQIGSICKKTFTAP